LLWPTDCLVLVMVIRKIVENVFYIGLDDDITEFFEGIWPLPWGVTYNTYLVLDEKIALIEPGVREELAMRYISELESVVDLSEIDYIVVNHSEPDHSGSLPLLCRLTKAKIVASKFGVNLLRGFYNIAGERLVGVSSGDSISLGETKLRFISIAGVHWPDSMVTYETKNKILFSSDAFGAFGSLRGAIFDDEIDKTFYLEEAKRYFVNIIGKFAGNAGKAIDSLSSVDIRIIAPAHGPVWRTDIDLIVNLYRDLSNRMVRDKVTLIYGSMYGFTENLAIYIAGRIAEKGVEIEVFNVTHTHPSFTMASAWDSKVVVFGGPTYDNDIFPPLLTHVDYLRSKMLKNKKYALFGSYGWSGKGYRRIQKTLEELEWELIEPIVEFRGAPTSDAKRKADELIENIVRAIKG